MSSLYTFFAEIKQTDYAEIQDVYEKLMENKSSINFENFQDVYKRLLSVQRDGKTILFHAYHVGKDVSSHQ